MHHLIRSEKSILLMLDYSVSGIEVGKFTDKLGRFQPPEGLMLASRYHVLSILPSWGQSAMLVRAQVLFM